ncbi:MAG: molybdopterin/thiamine biosynthesis adenylyltransferase [Candidatus Azotimanducaceae bacterium]|jgi:molybdopterin/thiamine biosynthesis adenylyltransferase
MNDDELLRYSRQIMLPDIDIAGQEKLKQSRVLIVGAGGLGSPVSLYLAASGVGHITLVDHDEVDLSNLARQVVHDTGSIGKAKVASAKSRLLAINPEITINAVASQADTALLNELMQSADLVLDCTDNFTVRFQINAAAWQHKVALVSGAAIGWEGQVSVFDANDPSSPCYQCLYREGDDNALNCAENGVIAPLVGIIGTVQAMEAIKHLTGTGQTLVGRVLYLDAKYMEWRSLKLAPLKDCPCCGKS